MICTVQRVLSCSVTVGGETVSSQERGFLLLLGVAGGDGESDADALASKIARLRVFEDENGKMNKNVTDAGGRITVVPNFSPPPHRTRRTGFLNISNRSSPQSFVPSAVMPMWEAACSEPI